MNRGVKELTDQKFRSCRRSPSAAG